MKIKIFEYILLTEFKYETCINSAEPLAIAAYIQNIIKFRWLWYPTHELVKKQWWSLFSMQWLHRVQWCDRGGASIIQVKQCFHPRGFKNIGLQIKYSTHYHQYLQFLLLIKIVSKRIIMGFKSFKHYKSSCQKEEIYGWH